MHFGGQNLNPATFKYSWQGDWKPHVVYGRHDVVRHRGRTWYAKNDAGVKDRYQGYYYEPGKSNFWENHSNGNVNRGGWSPQRTYHKGDLVSYKGDWYVCVTGGRGIHPVYDHGALTNKWTRVTKSPRMSNPGKFVPTVAGQSPLGWDRYYGTDAPMQQGMAGCVLIDWDGNPSIRGGLATGSTYLGSGGLDTTDHVRRGKNFSFPWTDFLEHNKQPITGELEIIQVMLTSRNAWYLANNGEVFHHGDNVSSVGGTGNHTTRNYGTSTVGKDNGATGTNWNAAIASGSFRDAFIIKIAAANSGYDVSTSGNCIALDSDGNVWTWGEASYGALGYGHPEAGGTAAYDTNAGIPFKLDYTNWFGGAPIQDIWTFAGPVMTAGRQGCFALDTDGVIWAWGENHMGQLGAQFEYVRRPLPVFNTSKYGGLKKIAAAHGYYGSTFLLMNDGSLHLSGSRAASTIGEVFTGSITPGSDTNDMLPGFHETSQWWYNTYKKQYNSALSMADMFTDVQNIWLTENENTFHGNVAWQNYDRDIFVAGDALYSVPVTESFSQSTTFRANETNRISIDSGPGTFPMLTDWSSLNGQVEYWQWFGTALIDTNNDVGCAVLTEDGRIKAAGHAFTNGDNTGIGITTTDTAGYGGNNQAFDQGGKILFADEMLGVGELNGGGATSQHFGPMSQKATHMGGIRGTTLTDGAYVTFYEDGTAGFFGRSQTAAANPIGQRNNFSGITVVDTGRQQGRVRAD